MSRSGYYAWLKRTPRCQKQLNALQLLYWEHRARLGAPSLVHDMRDKGYCLSERTVSRMLHTLGLRSKIARKFKYKIDPEDRLSAAKNLLERQFKVSRPNKVWTTDITYIWTQHGWLYLCVMLDLFSRRIVGWQTSKHIDRHLVCDAFNYAMARQGYPRGVMVHSDQGSQYGRHDYRDILVANGTIQSMSRLGLAQYTAHGIMQSLKASFTH